MSWINFQWKNQVYKQRSKTTTQLRDTNGKKSIKEDKKNFFIAILRTIPRKEGTKMIEIWSNSVRFDTISQRFADQARMILMKVFFFFSDLEIVERKFYRRVGGKCTRKNQQPDTTEVKVF